MSDLDPPPTPFIHRLSLETFRRAAASAMAAFFRGSEPDVRSLEADRVAGETALEGDHHPPAHDAGLTPVPLQSAAEPAVVAACRWIEREGTSEQEQSVQTVLMDACQTLVCSGAVPEGCMVWRTSGNDGESGSRWAALGDALKVLGIPRIQPDHLSGLPVEVPGRRGTLLVVVGVWEESGHRTMGNFREAGDAVVLLSPPPAAANPPSPKDGQPLPSAEEVPLAGDLAKPALESVAVLHSTILGLIHEGVIRSAAGCAQGGLVQALGRGVATAANAAAESAALGVRVDFTPGATDETPPPYPGTGWVVVTVAPADTGRVVRQAAILGVPAWKIGTVGGDRLVVAAPEGSEGGVDVAVAEVVSMPSKSAGGPAGGGEENPPPLSDPISGT